MARLLLLEKWSHCKLFVCLFFFLKFGFMSAGDTVSLVVDHPFIV